MAGRSQFSAVKEDFGGFTTVSELVASLRSAAQNAEGLAYAEDIFRREIEGRKKENELLQIEKLGLEKKCKELNELASRLREVIEDCRNEIMELKKENCELECEKLRAKTDVYLYQSRIKELEGMILSLGKDAYMNLTAAQTNTDFSEDRGCSQTYYEYASHESAREMLIERQLEKAHSGKNVAEYEPGVHKSSFDMEIEKDASMYLITSETNAWGKKVRKNFVKSEALWGTNANPSDGSSHKKRRAMMVVDHPLHVKRVSRFCEQHGRTRSKLYQGLAFGNSIPIVHDRSSLLWAQCLTKEYRCMSRVNTSVPGEWYRELPTAVRARVDGTCFHPLISCLVDGGGRISQVCLTPLLERWSDTTHTFHLPIGEMTVTPLDFAAITGLSFEGSPPPFGSRFFEPEQDLDLVQDLIGIRLQRRGARLIPYKLLSDRWRGIHTPVGADVDRYARAYLWYVLSCTLFPTAGSTADLAILEALWDLDRLGSYSWGSSALASIYRGLDKCCRGSISMSGLSWVVEIWGYEYEVLQRPWTARRDQPGFPRLGHWMGSRKDVQTNMLLARQRLDVLVWDQIRPHPWGVTEEGWLPVMVHARYITNRRVLLEDHLDRSWYLGERVFNFVGGVAARRVPRPPPELMFWGADLPDGVELEALIEGFPVEGFPGQPETALLEPFVEGAYEKFISEHLLGPIGHSLF